MKTIIIVRHAKSSWADLGQQDFDRPLNARGLADAPKMGERLAARNVSIDLLVTSTALRAQQTAQLIAAPININVNSFVLEPKLYHAPSYLIDAVICSLPNDANTVVIVCHNNGITDWVNEQTGPLLPNMPTCGMACFTASEINNWKQWPTANKLCSFIDYPKLGLEA
jgi:phosphohistidine phosphatase